MKKVLIIDDDKIYALMHKRMLELTGLPVDILTAVSGAEALMIIQSTWFESSVLPDIILLDLMMPGMDGFEFIIQLRKLQFPGIENVSVVILSSSSDRRDLLRSDMLGASAYLVKPVSLENLKETISG
jgi:CheY-like chemotaxis protein